VSDAATAHKPMPMLPQSAPGDEPMELDERAGSCQPVQGCAESARAHCVPQHDAVEGRSRAQVQVEEVVPPITKAAVPNAASCREREHTILEAR